MTKQTFTMLIGLPGSGKSTYAQSLANENTEILSSDKLREELYGNESTQGNPADVFNLMHKRTVEALKEGKDVIYDATNVNAKKRINLLKQLSKFNIHKKAIVIATPYNKCIKQDSKRERKIGASVIKKFYFSFHSPHKTEGWDEIDVINDEERTLQDLEKILDLQENLDQHNSHHTLTLDEHTKSVLDYVMAKNLQVMNLDSALVGAARFHDIGKPYTMSFLNSKGEFTNEAHFYQHENVGAYIILENGYFIKNAYADYSEGIAQLLDVAFYVNKHMEYRKETMEKREHLILKKYGDKYGKSLLILQEADGQAH